MAIIGIFADNLSKAGWSWGCVSAVDSRGRTIFIADANHRKQARIPNSEVKRTYRAMPVLTFFFCRNHPNP